MEILRRLICADEPWSSYGAMDELQDADCSKVRTSEKRLEMMSHPLVRQLIEEVSSFEGSVLSSHKSAGQPYHKLAFLADIGASKEDPGMASIIEGIWTHVSDDGLIEIPMKISEGHGGSGKLQWAWAACDAPILLYSAAKIAGISDTRVDRGLAHLIGLVRENGWGCTVSDKLGNFRGPGRKADPCPYVNLIMLKLISLFEGLKEGPEACAGVHCLLDLWERSLITHPYIFYMGNDFRKLKAPFIWYDILHVLEALSHFPIAISDARFRDMLALVNSKSDQNGMFRAESVWNVWKSWDFGQTKLPSSWISLCVERINRRVRQHDSRDK